MNDFKFSGAMVGASFDAHVRQQLPFYDLVTDSISVIVRNYLQPNGLIYDIGASTGNITTKIAPIAKERNAQMVSLESSPEMAKSWNGVGSIEVVDACSFVYENFDVAVCNLVLMFMPLEARQQLLKNLLSSVKVGGAIVLVEKTLVDGGYFGTVLRRMTWQWKLSGGATYDEIVKKELSLSGVQRPLDESELINNFGAKQFFRLGEFSGWVIEA